MASEPTPEKPTAAGCQHRIIVPRQDDARLGRCVACGEDTGPIDPAEPMPCGHPAACVAAGVCGWCEDVYRLRAERDAALTSVASAPLSVGVWTLVVATPAGEVLVEWDEAGNVWAGTSGQTALRIRRGGGCRAGCRPITKSNRTGQNR